MEYLEENLKKVNEKIIESAVKSGRSPEDIRVVAVTKTVPPDVIQKAVDCGITILGENRVQEARSKVDLIKGDVEWHLIGHLQKNKVKTAVRLFSMVQSVDSLELAREIDRRAGEINKTIDVLIQVNIGKEATKFGIDYEETEDFIKEVSQLPWVKVRGLMAIAPFKENPEDTRPYFKKMHDLFISIKSLAIENVEMEYLSMGMTNDFTVAIEEGSNMVRIGTGIFGERKAK
jgi:hypothetical protein